MRGLIDSGRIAVVAIVAVAFCACAGNGGSGLQMPGALPNANASAAEPLLEAVPDGIRKKIRHIVIIVQENRSFDNLFQGFDGADTHSYGYDKAGDKITLQPVGLETYWDVEHDSYGFIAACDGQGSYPGTNCKMDGFDQEYWGCGSSCPNSDPPYSYVPHNETAPYFTMGKEYVLADRMFASNFDESSFIAHQYIIAAQAESAVNYPYGPWGCEGGPGDLVNTLTQQRQIQGYIEACFSDDSLGQELDKAGKSWRFYTSNINYGSAGSLWSAYQANSYVYNGPDWKTNIIYPQTQFFNDVTNGVLPEVSWITPTCANSDHAGCGSNTGPSWVTSLVNAIGESKYWKSTFIFILWDDPGGWYEHVPPKKLDYDGLGMRIPLLMISPYAKTGCVTHVPYEHGAILKFVENRFGLPRLSASDRRANSPEQDSCFDFLQAPRAFVPISAPHNKNYFLHQPIDLRPPDTN